MAAPGRHLQHGAMERAGHPVLMLSFPPCRHYPKQSFTMVADTPENLRLKQQSELQSQVSMHCVLQSQVRAALCFVLRLLVLRSLLRCAAGELCVGLFCCLLFHSFEVAVSCLPQAPPTPQWDFPCWHPALQRGEMERRGVSSVGAGFG